MKNRKLKTTWLANVVLIALIIWNHILLTLNNEVIRDLQVMQISFVASLLVNNGFYFVSNVSSKHICKKGKDDEKC